MALFLAALAGPWIVLLGTNMLLGDPPTRHDARHCTRYCHDHGCGHDPVLPAVLSSDRGLYGKTIEALYSAGELTGLDRRTGYGAANLVVFCLLWPGGMLALLAVGLAQRVRLGTLRRRR